MKLKRILELDFGKMGEAEEQSEALF